MKKAIFTNGEFVLFDKMIENGDDRLFFREGIGLVHAQHKENIKEIIDNDDTNSSDESRE